MLRRPERSALKVAAAVACLAGGLSGLSMPAVAGAAAHPALATTSPVAAAAAGNPFCQGLGKRYLASSAAWAFCKGPQQHGPSVPHAHAPAAGHLVPGAPGNVDAASPAEDVSPGGLRSYGQQETSVGASGPYVVEAWNDATGFFSACPSPKAQITGRSRPGRWCSTPRTTAG